MRDAYPRHPLTQKKVVLAKMSSSSYFVGLISKLINRKGSLAISQSLDQTATETRQQKYCD